MQKIALIAFLISTAVHFYTNAEGAKKMSWFNNKDCKELNIFKYKSISDDSVLASTTIKNKSSIDEIIRRIEALPAEGDKYVSFGRAAKRTVLSFTCGNGEFQEIQIINSKFKTPSTAFLSSKNTDEENLSRDLDGLVQPDLNKRILKINDHSINFKDFSITFLKDTHTPQPEGGPTVGPTSESLFSIYRKSSANETQLKIFTGQIPPQPQEFVIGKKIYYLLTYQNAAKEGLYSKYFEVSEKLPK